MNSALLWSKKGTACVIKQVITVFFCQCFNSYFPIVISGIFFCMYYVHYISKKCLFSFPKWTSYYTSYLLHIVTIKVLPAFLLTLVRVIVEKTMCERIDLSRIDDLSNCKLKDMLFAKLFHTSQYARVKLETWIL